MIPLLPYECKGKVWGRVHTKPYALYSCLQLVSCTVHWFDMKTVLTSTPGLITCTLNLFTSVNDKSCSVCFVFWFILDTCKQAMLFIQLTFYKICGCQGNRNWTKTVIFQYNFILKRPIWMQYLKWLYEDKCWFQNWIDLSSSYSIVPEWLKFWQRLSKKGRYWGIKQKVTVKRVNMSYPLCGTRCIAHKLVKVGGNAALER